MRIEVKRDFFLVLQWKSRVMPCYDYINPHRLEHGCGASDPEFFHQHLFFAHLVTLKGEVLECLVLEGVPVSFFPIQELQPIHEVEEPTLSS